MFRNLSNAMNPGSMRRPGSGKGGSATIRTKTKTGFRRDLLRTVSFICLAGAALTALSAGEARSQTWTGNAADNNWFTPNNWNPAGPPVASGTTILDNGATPVIISSAGALANYLSIGNVAGSTGTLTVMGAGTLTTSDAVNGLIVGDVGNGTLTISGGGTVNSQTVVLANNAGTTGVATVTGTGSSWTGGTFYIAADHSTANLTVSAGGKLTASVIDVADFVPGGSGTVTVTGPGSSIASTGSLSVGTGAGDSGAFNVLNGAAANISGFFGIGSNQGSGAFNVLGGGTVTSSTAGPVLIGSGSGVGTATVSGAGSTWTITGQFNNDALDVAGVASSSTLTISNGGQVIVSPTAGGAGSGNVTIGGAGNVTASMLVDGAGSTFTSPTNLVLGAAGAGSLTISNGGAVYLTSAGSLLTLGGGSGSSGVLNIGAAAGSAAVAPGTLNAGGVVFSSTATGPLAVNFNHTSSNYVFATPITGTGAVNSLAGTTIFTTNQTYSGSTSIALGATLQLGNGGATGFVTTNIADSGALIIDHSTSFASTFLPYQGVLSGSGLFTLTGGGSLNLNGDSSGFSGTTNINNGTLNIAADLNGTGKLGSAKMDVGVNAGDNASISVYDTLLPVPHTGAALAVSGQLIIGDAGTGVVGNGNGGVISDGSLVVGAQAGSSGQAVASGGAWTNAGTVEIGLNGSGRLSVGSGATFSDATATIGDGNGSKGTVILAGTGALWSNSGAVTIAAQAGSTGALDIGGPVGYGALNPGAITASSILFGAGNGALNFNHTSSNYVFSTPITGVGTVNVLAGATIFTADNTYGGATNLSAGATLQLGNGGPTGSITSGVANSGVLTFDRSGSFSYGGAISGAGEVNFLAGTTHFTGASTYTGSTSVTDGQLFVDGSLGNTAVIVGSGAALGGSGSISGSVNVASGGALIGASGQTLTMGSLTLNSGSNVDVSLGAPSATRLFDVIGNLVLAGALNVTNAGGFGGGVYRLFDYGGVLTNNGLAVGALPAGDSGLIQTSIANQVNLVVSGGVVPTLQFWNGVTTSPTGTVVGGSGTWTAGPTTNWTDAAGASSTAWGGNFAVFQGAPGVVQVDGSAGAVSTTGMQFIGAGWSVVGNPITLNGAGGQTTIRVGDGSAAGASDIATIASVLTGSSGLVKTDLGTLILSGANNYTGATSANAGTLKGGAANVFSAASATTVNAGGILDLGGFAQTINTVALAGGVLQSGTLVGAVTSNGGAINGLGGNASVTITAGVTIALGANAYTGATTINGGAFDMAGTVSASNISVNASGVLTGAGKIGDPTINAGGTLAPGDPAAGPGTLTIVGPLTFMPGSFYDIRITPAASDRANVTGVASLGGATVDVIAGSGTYAPKTRYTILTATGGLAGSTFNPSVATNLAFLAPALSYDGNDVFLTVAPSVPTPSGTPDYRPAATNRNQVAVASGLTFAGALNGGAGPILMALDNTTLAGAQGAFDQLSGAGLAGAQNVAFQSSALFLSAMGDQGRYWLEGGPDANGVTLGAPAGALGYAEPARASAPVQGISDHVKLEPVLAAPTRSWRAWFTGFGAGETVNASQALGAPAQADSLYGGSFGLDYQIQPNLLAGVAGSFSTGVLSVGALSTSGNVHGANFGAYGVTTLDSFYAQGALAFTSFRDLTTRNVSGFGGLGFSAENGAFNAQELRGRLEIGRRYDFAAVSLTPFAALEVANLWSGAFVETGGLYGLAVQSRSQISAPASIGARAQRVFELGGGLTFTPSLTLAWLHEFAPQREIFATLVDLPGASWLVDAARTGSNAAQVKASAQLALNQSTTIFANFDGEFSGAAQSYAGKGGLRINW